jgi:hypothetical protein
MLRPRSIWRRVLQLHHLDEAAALLDETLPDVRVHARSRFRSADDPERVAVYSVHDADGAAGLLPLGLGPGGRPGSRGGEHTLVAVREFRRVPLDASSLALLLFTARPRRAVTVVAALARFVERAVDLYQPGYLLLAHSLEAPATSMLLTAVQDREALAAGSAAAFSLDGLLAELEPLLDGRPERYEYAPEADALSLTGAISPYAV